jgi:hypothetical protein
MLPRERVWPSRSAAGGGIPLFEDGLAPGSWKLVDSNATQSGALCLLYDRARG